MLVIISNTQQVLSIVLNQGAVGTVYQHPSRRDLVVKVYHKVEDCEAVRIQ